MGLADACCEGFTCTASWSGDVCMPPTPDPTGCTEVVPVGGDPCEELGLTCNISAFATCQCTCDGWLCAY
jgi:hypothetical protein